MNEKELINEGLQSEDFISKQLREWNEEEKRQETERMMKPKEKPLPHLVEERGETRQHYTDLIGGIKSGEREPSESLLWEEVDSLTPDQIADMSEEEHQAYDELVSLAGDLRAARQQREESRLQNLEADKILKSRDTLQEKLEQMTAEERNEYEQRANRI